MNLNSMTDSKLKKSQNIKEVKPLLLHIDIGNQSLLEWTRMNKYIIHSELLRYCENLIKNDFDNLEAIMISNLADNIVLLVSRENVKSTLKKAMDYFLEIEEYEQCAKIRDLLILISNKSEDYGRKTKKNNLQN